MKQLLSPVGLASRFINSTGRHVFLTGKAGTGKTTFLRDIVQYTHKKVIVAAPTGIAAINAGGVTLHSLFQLPFGAFLPSDEGLSQMHIATQVNTPKSLIGKLKMHATRRKMLREMELLIIDEVSMLRADLLDAIDTVLRYVHRKRSVPFGGIQILFIGDLLQLPPVVKQEEWGLLQRFYEGIYFFQAKALSGNPPLYIELETIYRQTDPRFIELLNNLRENKPSYEDIELLNSHVSGTYNPTTESGYIFLTTHNHKADQINHKAIQKIDNPPHTFEAIIENDFPEHLYPMDFSLVLKEGAQVMFIKNDYSGERRYFNGKIGEIESIGDEGVTVCFDDGSPSAEVERYTWENKKFSLNKETNEIEEKVAGTFTQYPLKLAWAVTIHKSQGLTFEKAVIDVSSAFASGQIYVALSRLTGLGGLVLSAPLPVHAPGPDHRLIQFSASKPAPEVLEQHLDADTLSYLQQQLLTTFEMGRMAEELRWHVDSYNKEEGRSVKQKHQEWARGLQNDFQGVQSVADRFLGQLQSLFQAYQQQAGQLRIGQQQAGEQHSGQYQADQYQADQQHTGHAASGGMEADQSGHDAGQSGYLVRLQERVAAAATYFKPIMKELSYKVFEHIEAISGLVGVKTYIRELRDLETLFFSRQQLIVKAEALLKAVMENTEPTKSSMHDPATDMERRIMTRAGGKQGKAKLAKGKTKKNLHQVSGTPADSKDTPYNEDGQKLSSYEVTYSLYKEGLDVETIAKLRTLAESTIEGHLARCVTEGLLDVSLFLDAEKMTQILAAAQTVDSTALKDIMAVLGDEFTYADVRYALAGRKVE